MRQYLAGTTGLLNYELWIMRYELGADPVSILIGMRIDTNVSPEEGLVVGYPTTSVMNGSRGV